MPVTTNKFTETPCISLLLSGEPQQRIPSEDRWSGKVEILASGSTSSSLCDINPHSKCQ